MLRVCIPLSALILWSSAVSAATTIPLLPPPKLQASSYLLIDSQTQTVIAEHNAQERNPPCQPDKDYDGLCGGRRNPAWPSRRR
jgi:D-alanyl-D-alanine carboxypeptidase